MAERSPSAASQDESLGTLFTRTVEEAREVASAEIALQKARVLAALDEAKAGAVLLIAAAVCACMMLTAIVVGALLILSHYLGPVWATVIVVGVLLLLSGVLALLGIAHFKRMFSKT